MKGVASFLSILFKLLFDHDYTYYNHHSMSRQDILEIA